MPNIIKSHEGGLRIFSNEKDFPKKEGKFNRWSNWAINSAYDISVKEWFSTARWVDVHPGEVEKFKKFVSAGKPIHNDQLSLDGIQIPDGCFEVREIFKVEEKHQYADQKQYAYLKEPTRESEGELWKDAINTLLEHGATALRDKFKIERK